MKWSKYNSILENGDGNFVLYNASTNHMVVMVEQVKDMVTKHTSSPDDIKSMHLELYNCLLNYEFIVDDDTDETERFISSYKSLNDTGEEFSLIINPTMNCNLRCWYCYETHKPKSLMPLNIRDRVCLLLTKKFEDEHIKKISLSFFGGEPLLAFKSRVLPLINHAVNLKDRTGKELNIGFTSNAVLLTKEVVDKLHATGLSIHFLIPFDGDKQWHDKTKRNADGSGTYDRIVANVHYALSKGFDIIVRCNYSNENLESFERLIDDFKSMFENYSDRISFSFHRISQRNEPRNSMKFQAKYQSALNTLGIESTVSNDCGDTCYADKENSVVINFNGDVYKCTARDFIKESREGVLNADGTITYNERYSDRMDIRFKNETCRKCNIFPLCNICTQHRLESFENDSCLRGFNEQDKLNLISSKVKTLGKLNC